MPDKLYKYRSLTAESRDFTRDIIEESRLYFSPVRSLNDPSEGVQAANQWEFANPYQGDLQRRVDLALGGTGVLAFSAKANDVLMWSHYSDSHAGICLEFDPGALPFSTDPVTYSRSPPRDLYHFEGRLEGPGAEAWVANFMAEHQKRVLLCKAKQWEYEEEWRALSPQPGAVSFPRKALTGVIYGLRISAQDVEWLEHLLEAHGRERPRLYRATRSENSYDFEIVPH